MMRVASREIDVSRPDKLLYPDEELSKRDVVDHFQAVAEVMLPHLADRPLVLRRYPDGIDAEGFFQKDASDYFPDWLATVEVPLRTVEGTVSHVVCQDAAHLVYLAGQATLEFNSWLSTTDDLDHPDRLVVDIDPPPGVDVVTLRTVARWLRDFYDAVGLTPFVQATGGRGYHVVAPLDRSADYRQARDLATRLADHLAAQHSDLLTTAQRKHRRGNRIFLDINRNAYGQTFITPYSLRARAGAPVATPLDWTELGRSTPNRFTLYSIGRRLARKADPWADIDRHAASAAAALDRLDDLAA